jgi:hypothetical protein
MVLPQPKVKAKAKAKAIARAPTQEVFGHDDDDMDSFPRPAGRPLSSTCMFLDGSEFLAESLADLGKASSVVVASYLTLGFCQLHIFLFCLSM